MPARKKKPEPRLQKLSALDEMVMALLKEDVPLILGWDGEKNIFMEAIISDVSCDDDPPFDQGEWLEYMVSEGLPGARSAAESYYTFADAQTAFDVCCQTGRVG